MNGRRRWTLLMVLLVGAQAYAQVTRVQVDSILALRDDTVKVIALSDLCFAYRRVNGDSALYYGRSAAELARKLAFPRGEAQAFNDMAIIHIDRSDFRAADSALHRALSIRLALKDSAGIGAVYNKLGNMHQAQSRFEEALAENLEALRIFERIGPKAKEALILNNIAILQNNLRRHADALATQERAVDLLSSIGDSTGLATSWGNMANSYLALGDTGRAIAHYEAAAQVFRRRDMQRELGVQLHNLAGAVLEQGDRQRAERLYREALSIRERTGEKKAIASSLIGLGKTLMKAGKWSAALPLQRRALTMGREVNARNERMQALLDIALVHARMNNGDSSYWYHDRYVLLKDSVFNEDLSAQVAEMQERYQAEKRERELLQQRAQIAVLARESERRRSWLVLATAGAGMVLLAALLMVQVQRRRARAQRDAAIIREREAGLKAVIEATEEERRRLARELHDGVGQQLGGLKHRLEHLRGATDAPGLQDTITIVDDTAREVRDLAHQLMPKTLSRLGLVPAVEDLLHKAFKGTGTSVELDHVGLEAGVPDSIATGLYRMVQELVGNILKHAHATAVEVQLLRNKGHVVLIVQDNGRGLVRTEGAGGLGLMNIADRARALGGTFAIEAVPGHGTVATIRVPLPQ